MKRISVPLPALIIFCIFFFSCQKDAVENNLQALNNKSTLEELKSYYQNEMAASVRGSNGPKLIGPAVEEPDWSNAVYSAGEKTYLIPVKIKASRANKDVLVSRYLVINEAKSKKDGFFYYAIADRRTNKPISQQQMLTSLQSYEDGVNEIKKTGYTFVKVPLSQNELFQKETGRATIRTGKFIAQKKATQTQQTGGSNVESFAPRSCSENGGTAVTIDWYYQIYVDGVLVYEEYLYSTTECWGATNTGGGGESGEDACRQAASEFMNSGAATNELISSSTVFEKSNFKTDKYDWKIFSASTWGIVSSDQITWTRASTNLAWTYSSYSHIGDSEVGMSIGGSRTYKIMETYATSYVSGAKVRIDFTVSHQPVCKETKIVINAVTMPYNANIIFKPRGVVMPSI